MRVCHVIVSDRAWGAFRVVAALAKFQARRADVTVAMNQELLPLLAHNTVSLKTLLMPLGSPFTWPKKFGYLGFAGRAWVSGRLLSRYVATNGVDVLHLHFPNSLFLAAMTRVHICKVATVYGPFFESPVFAKLGSLLANLGFRGVSAVTVVNPDLIPYLRDKLSIKSVKRVLYVPYGVDLESLRRLSSEPLPGPLLERLMRVKSSGFPILCFVGRLEARKGPDLLLRALPLLKKEYPRLLCIFVGDGPLMEQLKNLSKLLDVDDVVLFVGFQANPYNFMKYADVVLANLRANLREPGLPVLEALALRKLVVTRYDEAKSRMLHNYVVYNWTDDATSVAQAVRAALAKLKSGDYECDFDRIRIPSWEDLADAYLELYHSVLGR